MLKAALGSATLATLTFGGGDGPESRGGSQSHFEQLHAELAGDEQIQNLRAVLHLRAQVDSGAG